MDGLINYAILCAVSFAAAAVFGLTYEFFRKRRPGYKPPPDSIGL